MNGSGMAVAVRNITNTGCFLPHGVRSVASNLRPVWVLCVWIFTPENFPKIFRYANSHSRMYRGSDVFAEVQRYFYENSVYGSKIAVVLVHPAQSKSTKPQDALQVGEPHLDPLALML